MNDITEQRTRYGAQPAREREPQRLPVSVIVMTKNEEKNIEKCLHSLRDFGEVFVVDSGSTDRTVELAEKNSAKVIQFRWNGKYPKKKQWSLEQVPAAFDWVLFVDADEEVTPALTDEIRSLFENGSPESGIDGYFIPFNYVFMGRELRHGQKVIKLALLRRGHARFPEYDDLDAETMWEVEGHYQPVLDGQARWLKSAILHRDHDTLFHFFDRHNRYSDWEAHLRIKRFAQAQHDTQPGIRGVLKSLFQKLPLQGLIYFVYYYLLRGGFLDGRAGLDFAVAKAFYYWQIQVKIRELSRAH